MQSSYDYDAIIRRTLAGDTINTIAEKLGCSISTVARARRIAAAGNSDYKLAIDYRRGATLTECAEQMGVSIATVRRRLINLGVDRRPRGRRPQR